MLRKLRVAFRVDASIEIGTGHVMRCLALADALSKRGAFCHFICREHPGNLLMLITEHGHQITPLPLGYGCSETRSTLPHASWLGDSWENDANQTQSVLKNIDVGWLIVDHYALDQNWESAIRPYCHHLMVIDDLADRPHLGDILLDQNLGRSAKDYDDLVRPQTQRFIGLRYALLRPEFAQWRDYSLARRTQPQFQRLLITMGGVDKNNITGRVLSTLTYCELPPSVEIIAVLGINAPHLASVKSQALTMPWSTHVMVGVNNMAQLMAESDLAIGAAGSTSWERCCLGLPAIILVLAENQRSGAEALQQANAAISLSEVETIKVVLPTLIPHNRTYALKAMSEAAANLLNGNGIQTLIERMLNNHV